jgi:peroxiredoxin
MKYILVVLIIAAVGLGGYIYLSQPDEIPNITLKSPDGRSVDLDAMRGDRDEILLVFLLPNCPASKFALALVQQQYPGYSASVAFAGLFFGNQAAADKFKSDQQLPFPVYGLRDAVDPYAVNEFIETVGTSHGLRSAIYGGTLVMINSKREVLFALAKEDIKQLPEKLADLGY